VHLHHAFYQQLHFKKVVICKFRMAKVSAFDEFLLAPLRFGVLLLDKTNSDYT
jgi:hypothetical protein